VEILLKKYIILSLKIYNAKSSILLWSCGLQAAKGGFLSFKSEPLQKQCFLYLPIIFIIVSWSLMILMKKVDKAANTELTISNLPTWFRKFEVDTSLLSILCTRGSKSSTYDLFGPRGSPRYVKG
jgi:hypothetical protein